MERLKQIFTERERRTSASAVSAMNAMSFGTDVKPNTDSSVPHGTDRNSGTSAVSKDNVAAAPEAVAAPEAAAPAVDVRSSAPSSNDDAPHGSAGTTTAPAVSKSDEEELALHAPLSPTQHGEEDAAASVVAAGKAARTSHGWLIHTGYADDSINTDNAWLETTVGHFPCDEQIGADLILQEGAGATSVRWVSVPPIGVTKKFDYWNDLKVQHQEWVRAALLLRSACE